jgi:hypothetical protein
MTDRKSTPSRVVASPTDLSRENQKAPFWALCENPETGGLPTPHPSRSRLTNVSSTLARRRTTVATEPRAFSRSTLAIYIR